jgi:hypothetical protein
MRSLIINLDEADFSRLEQEAARRGGTPEELSERLLRASLAEVEESGRAVRLLRDMSERSGLSLIEGEQLAREEIAAMRAERRAGRS